MGLGHFKNNPEAIRAELIAIAKLGMVYDLLQSNVEEGDWCGRYTPFLTAVSKATPEQLRREGISELQQLQAEKQRALSLLPFKHSWRDSCAVLLEQIGGRKFTQGTGIPVSWLRQHFTTLKFVGLEEDTPGTGAVGFGKTIGAWFVPDRVLLEDAFLLLEKTHRTRDTFSQFCKARPDARMRDPSMARLLSNVSSFARLTLFSFVAFAEAFVNSVGADFAQLHPQLPPDTLEKLNGSAKGRFLSLEKKMTLFPTILNPGVALPYNLSDPQQIREPFATFLNDLKETRDSIAHHASSKAQILFLPDDWLTKATTAAQITTECCKLFWCACYPQRALPAYLDQLDVTTHSKIAHLRLEAESASATTQQSS